MYYSVKENEYASVYGIANVVRRMNSRNSTRIVCHVIPITEKGEYAHRRDLWIEVNKYFTPTYVTVFGRGKCADDIYNILYCVLNGKDFQVHRDKNEDCTNIKLAAMY